MFPQKPESDPLSRLPWGLENPTAARHPPGQHSDVCDMISVASYIWLIPNSLLFSPKDLEYRDGILVAGSLEALIDLLTPTESHYPEVGIRQSEST